MKPNPISVVTFDLDDTLWAVRPVLLKAEDIVFDWLELTVILAIDDLISGI